MPVVTTNEEVRKDVPQEAVKKALALLEEYGVPPEDLFAWLRANPDLLIALKKEIVR